MVTPKYQETSTGASTAAKKLLQHQKHENYRTGSEIMKLRHGTHARTCATSRIHHTRQGAVLVPPQRPESTAILTAQIASD